MSTGVIDFHNESTRNSLAEATQRRETVHVVIEVQESTITDG